MLFWLTNRGLNWGPPQWATIGLLFALKQETGADADFFIRYGLDGATTNISWGSYAESGRLTALEWTAQAHCSAVALHQVEESPCSVVAGEGRWEGHTAMLSNSNVLNTMARTNADIHPA